MLAHSDPEAVRSLVAKPLQIYTSRTIADPDRLLRELEDIRRRGYSINEGESHEGLSAVAAAIWRYPAELAGAVAVAGPSFRFTPERLARFGEMVMQTAGEISRQLGGVPPRGTEGSSQPPVMRGKIATSSPPATG